MIRVHRDEEGAYLILWALLLLALLTMVAIVIDLGRLRDTRRQAQRSADLAALAAGQNISGGDIVNGCKAAVAYVRTHTSLATLSESCAADFALACDGNPAVPPVRMVTTSGAYTVTVQNPVHDTEIEDPSYPVNSGGLHVLEDDGLPCERMRVTVQKINSALFAGVIGVNDLKTSAAAVVRGFIGNNPTQNAGLVILERKSCEALVAGGGAGLASVLVKGSIAFDGTPRPGIIQVDSKALTPPGGNCTSGGGNPSSKYAVFGGRLAGGADRPGAPSIEAQSIGGAPGRLDMYALTFDRTNTHTAYDVPGGGVSPGPTPGVIASRTVVDSVYNAPVGGGPGRVRLLKNNSQALLTSLATAVATCPLCNLVTGSDGFAYHVYPPGTPGGPDAVTGGGGVPTCSTNTATLIDVPAAFPRVYVNCATLDVPNLRFLGSKTVIGGVLRIGSNRMAQFPNASEVVVAGCGGCPPGNTKAIDAAGALLINTGPNTPLVKQCNDSSDNDGDGKTDYNATFGMGDIGCQTAADWDELSCLQDRGVGSTPPTGPSRLVVATGPIETSSSAIVELCQTFVLMADGSDLPSQDSSAATDATCAGYVDTSGVTVAQPCPKTNGYKGSLSFFGTIDWTAPDQTPLPRDTSLANQNFEDLALWTESSNTSEIKGSGATITGGVFFLPNALMKFSGQASQFIDLNAQFISRRLEASGQGTLSMKPNPNDVVDTPAPYYKLIR